MLVIMEWNCKASVWKSINMKGSKGNAFQDAAELEKLKKSMA